MHFLISTVEDIYKNCNMYRYKKAVCEIHTAFSLMMKIYKVSDSFVCYILLEAIFIYEMSTH